MSSTLHVRWPRTFALLTFALLAPASVAGQGLTARFAPEAGQVRWAGGIGLSDANLYGGGLSMGFGRYVFLKSSYSRASGLTTSLIDAGFADASSIRENVVDAELFSTEVQLRLGSRRIAPVLSGGGGVFGLAPSGRDEVRQVFVGYGAGVDMRLLPWLDAQVLLKDLRFRLDRATLAERIDGIDLPLDDERGEMRRSWALGVSVGARLGAGRRSGRADDLDQGFDALYSGGLERLLIPVETTVGRLTFADALGIDDQTMAGLRTGVDLGPYFGLRGSYASGLSGFDSFVGVKSWAGEAQFNLGRVTTASPHVLVGFGQILFDEDIRDRNGVTPPDQSTLIVGAGFGLPINDKSRFLVSIRDYITTAGTVSEASSTGDLRHNLGLSVGLSYLVRGRRTGAGRPGPTAPVTLVSAEAPAQAVAGTAAAATAGDTTRQALATTTTEGASPVRTAPVTDSAQAAGLARDTDYQSERMVTIPIPREGELYIRYGPAERNLPAAPQPVLPAVAATAQAQAQQPQGGSTTPTLAADTAALLAAVRSEFARIAQDRSSVTPADLTSMEDRILQRLLASGTRDEVDPRLTEALRDAQRREIDELSAQVRDLAGLVREGVLLQGVPSRDVVNVVPIQMPGAVGVVPVRRGPFLRGVEFRLGTTSVRDGRTGAGGSIDLSLGYLGSSRIRPYVGAEIGRTNVRTSFGGSSVIGSVISLGGGAGLALDLPGLGPVAPTFSAGLSGVAGGTSGTTAQDSELMDRLYGGLAMGPSVALGGTWLGSSRPAGMEITGRVRRVWAGARTRWSLEAGLRWKRDSARQVGTQALPMGQPQAVETGAPAARSPIPGDTARAARVDTVVVAGADSAAAVPTELLSRLEALEAELEQGRLAREQAEAQAAAAAQETLEARARADSIALESETLRAAERARAGEATARGLIRTELESLVAVLDHVVSVRSADRGLEVTLGGAAFPVGSYTLTDRARSQIERVATVIQRVDGSEILVDGHTDSSGAEEANLTISRLRAQAVLGALVDAGLDPSRITVLASGESRPIADNASADGRSRNRRVEIVVRGLGR